jgi:hypothetical protein
VLNQPQGRLAVSTTGKRILRLTGLAGVSEVMWESRAPPAHKLPHLHLFFDFHPLVPTFQRRQDLKLEKKCRFVIIPAHVATMAIRSASAAARWVWCSATRSASPAR